MFISYSERFNSIYGNQGKVVKTKVFVPGDNDIGGEGGDPVSSHVDIYSFHLIFFFFLKVGGI